MCPVLPYRSKENKNKEKVTQNFFSDYISLKYEVFEEGIFIFPL